MTADFKQRLPIKFNHTPYITITPICHITLGHLNMAEWNFLKFVKFRLHTVFICIKGLIDCLMFSKCFIVRVDNLKISKVHLRINNLILPYI